MKLESKPGEYKRIVGIVSRKSELLWAVARRGHSQYGRGAVFYCEVWGATIPRATPFFVAASEPEFAMAGTDIQRAVAVYRPSSEAVVIMLTKEDEVYVVRLRLPSPEKKELTSRLH